MNVYDELEWRGLINQVTSDDLRKVLASRKISLYIGFDPSASSLHVGSLIPLMTLVQFRRFGHTPIVLIGGATGLIGDPSGKSEERTLQTRESVEANCSALQRQIEGFLGEGDPACLFTNNIEWFANIRVIDFLRDVGKFFSVNQMLQRDSVRRRLENPDTGLSYTEFSYMLLQSYDYEELYRRFGCLLQCGASDQWGNIVSGIDLVQRHEGQTVYGLTMPLFTSSEGKKYGKSEKGTVWLDPAQTSPFRFYQFWINMPDADVGRCLRWFTLMPREEVEALEAQIGSPERAAQKALAHDVTARVHGRDEADKAVRASSALFSGDVAGLPAETLLEVFSDVPSVTIANDRLGGGVSLAELLVEAGASKSKSEARRVIEQGGVRINGTAVPGQGGLERKVGSDDLLEGRVLVLKVGKRNNYLVRATS